MTRCKACGKLFRLKKENRYQVEKFENVLLATIKGATVYECFDCPRCGCQNVCNTREVNCSVICGEVSGDQ